jgi:DNA repair exonuclease SbcCD ATPase subunit
MLVALGFAAASFLALVIGRSLWKLARRLNRRRLDSELPTIIAELRADRDRLRAEYAMQSRKFDVRVGELKARMAEHMAEVSRHRNRLELAAVESRRREAAIVRESQGKDIREQLEPLEAELAKRTETVQTLEQQLRERDGAIAALNRDIAELRATLARRERELAELQSATESAPPIPSVAPEIMTAQERLARRIEELTALSGEIASQRQQFAKERDKFSALRQAIALPAPPTIEDALELKEPREQIDAIDEHGRAIEDKLAAAERESEALAEELRSLDQEWSKKVEELDSTRSGPAISAAANENGEAEVPVAEDPNGRPSNEPAQPRRAAGNVVSLAARIKALQRDVTH